MKRRNFLGVLAASPLAAKQAAEKAAASLANVDVSGLERPNAIPGAGYTLSNEESKGAVRRLIVDSGIPEWKLEEMRQHSLYVSHLAPDVASLRSASLSGKIAIQRRRNFEQFKAGFLQQWVSPPSWFRKAQEFREKYGWPF